MSCGVWWLDESNGKPIWSTLTVDAGKPYTITQAPRVIKGRVIIGNSGGEYGPRGYISAYDAESGKLVWRFFTVPGDPAKPFENAAMAGAAKTWSGEWWKLGGGGPVWDAISYDPALNLLYFGVGNGIQWARSARSAGTGDNLFLSIVAPNADTGQYAWHYQATPGEDGLRCRSATGARRHQNRANCGMCDAGQQERFLWRADRKTELDFGQASCRLPKERHRHETGRLIINAEARYSETGKPVDVKRAVGAQLAADGVQSSHGILHSRKADQIHSPPMPIAPSGGI